MASTKPGPNRTAAFIDPRGDRLLSSSRFRVVATIALCAAVTISMGVLGVFLVLPEAQPAGVKVTWDALASGARSYVTMLTGIWVALSIVTTVAASLICAASFRFLDGAWGRRRVLWCCVLAFGLIGSFAALPWTVMGGAIDDTNGTVAPTCASSVFGSLAVLGMSTTLIVVIIAAVSVARGHEHRSSSPDWTG